MIPTTNSSVSKVLTTKLITKILRDAAHVVDDVSVEKKTGHIIARREFYYRHGQDSRSFRKDIEKLLSGKVNAQNFNIIQDDEVYKPFSGGASTRNSSHFWVKIQVV
jgi:hypothetical protein